MLSQERYKRIMEKLNEEGSITVVKMSELLGVSVDTIRRDIKYLEENNMLIRTHGGAVLSDVTHKSFHERRDYKKESKLTIGKEILHYIKDGDTLFLDGSTTTILFVPFLRSFKNLTLITNSMYTGIELIEKGIDGKVHILGGKVHEKIGTVVGIQAIEGLGNFHIDKAIMSSYAVHARDGFFDLEHDEALFKRFVISKVKQAFFLMDSSKLNLRSSMLISPFEDNTLLVVDDASDHFRSDFEKVQKGKLILSKNAK